MQVKAFAIIAAASLAISLGACSPSNSQERASDVERQGSAVCQQSLRKIADITIEANNSGAFSTVASLMKKDWKQMSLPEKRLYVRAMATMVVLMTEGLETMTLRKINSCPQHSLEKPWASMTEEEIGRDKDRLTWAQIQLALEQIGY